jgi:beta-galactosidase
MRVLGAILAGLGVPGAVFCTSAVLVAQTAQLFSVDASDTRPATLPSSYHGRASTSQGGRTIGLNSAYLTMDGKPWLPVMGEFHYSRYPQSDWEDEILKMKSSGVQIVSAYVIWIHHEEVEGHFDWSGQRDLRRFIQLCGKHGMYVVARIGPWAHGEVRNGGFPDWLLTKGPTRRNDPVYMSYVAKFYSQIGEQLHGLLWKDGGPVIGIQLENEYAERGPAEGDEHILALKKLAIASGLDVPLYAVTGWDNAVVPKGEVIPVFGGYPDAPWDASLENLPPNEVYVFRFGSRVSGNMGTMGDKTAMASASSKTSDTPFMTAEIGGGVQDTYHRRPVIQPDDVAAIVPVMLGSGVNLYGSYMFQGGENPDGKLTTLQESQATGYPNDLPVKSYDFQAPLGEFGQEREVFRKLKVFQYFLDDFGADLAPMTAHAPDFLPSSPSDMTIPRLAVRNAGDRGFVFMNNYVRGTAMPERRGFQLSIRLPGSILRVPGSPVNIPSGAYFIWPFNLAMGEFKLRYSTAQLFTRLERGNDATWFFFAIPGIRPEFSFAEDIHQEFTIKGAAARHEAGSILITDVGTGFDRELTLSGPQAGKLRIVVLTQQEAENTWKAKLGDDQFLIYSPNQFFASDHGFVLRSEGEARATFRIFPKADVVLDASPATLNKSADGKGGLYNLSVPEKHFNLRLESIRPAGDAPEPQLGPRPSWRPQGVALAPPDSAFLQAASWRLTVPPSLPASVSEYYLRVEYIGDIARVSAGGLLLDDDFFNGLPWYVGLKRYAGANRQGPLQLDILPLRADALVFFEDRLRPSIPARGQAMQLKSVKLIPEYQFVVQPKKEHRN